ncbi:MAG: hypothetical protein ACRCZD_18995 [Phycicoccus sp.]
MADADLAPIGIRRAGEMAPSLHLNLGDGYLRQGRLAEAAAQLQLAREALPHLPPGGYGDLVRRGVTGLAERVATAGLRRDTAGHARHLAKGGGSEPGR